jgi:trans-2,3-dihydro-3-hydroxyanthranilate isomerase
MRIQQAPLWSASQAGSAGLVREFLIADVFTGTPLEGSPLGIFPDGRGLSDELMLKAAREMGNSETAFLFPPEAPGADARVRIFTPGGELPFAGHSPLGSGCVLAAMLGKQAVTLQLGAGLVAVALEREEEAVTFGWVSQPVPAWGEQERSAVFLALGTTGKPGGLPVEWYRNGPLTVYVEMATEEALSALEPDMQKLARIPVNASCFTQTPNGYTTRMFAPALNVPEDPATGSAAGPLAVHLARHGRITFGSEIEIRQGAAIHRPSVLYARAEGKENTVERVLVGGRAVVVARGEYRLA